MFLKYRVKLPISARKVDSQFLGSNLRLALDRKKKQQQTNLKKNNKLKIAKFCRYCRKRGQLKEFKMVQMWALHLLSYT